MRQHRNPFVWYSIYALPVLIFLGVIISSRQEIVSRQPVTVTYLAEIRAQAENIDDGVTSLDWPQYQHDARRPAYNPGPPPSYSYSEAWSHRFEDDGINATAQPIIMGDILFVGTERGILYALNLSNGNEVWHRQLDSSIAHTPAANLQTVFVATLSGSIYALNRQNGNQLWHFSTVGSFGSALLLVNGHNTLYAANRYGKIHALDISTGSERWQTDIGFPILQSPTYGDGRVYVGAEDMKVYAVDVADGHIVWTSNQLYGRSFHDYAPVFAEGKVIVNVMPDTYTYSSNNIDLMREANIDASTSGDLAAAQEATVQWLDLNPKSQTFYVFDAATGQAPYRPGVLYSVVNSGAQPPPIYANGALYTAFHTSGPRWLRLHFGVGDHASLGRLDLNTGRIVERLAKTPGEFTVDETNNYAAVGDLFVGSRAQSSPRCMVVNDNCGINHSTLYPFTADLLLPGNAPIFASGYFVHHSFDTLTAYAAR